MTKRAVQWHLVFLFIMFPGCSDEHYDLRGIAEATSDLIAPPFPMGLSPDRSLLLLFTRTSSSALLQVMNLETREIVAEYAFDRPQPNPAPAWSPDGRHVAFVATIGDAYRLMVWDVATGRVIVPRSLLSKNVHGQGWDAKGARIFHFVHPLDDPSGWREGRRALYWVDPTGTEPPELILPNLGQSYHKSLSGDGRIAVFYPEDGERINLLKIFSGEGDPLHEFTLDATAEVGQIGWSGPESVRMSVRRSGDEFYGIANVDIRDGSVEWIVDGDWDLSAAGYIWDRTALQHVANVDGLRRTRICTLPVESDCWWIGPEGKGSSILSLHADGDSALALFSGPLDPPSVHAVDLRTGDSRPIFVPEPPIVMTGPAGVPLDVTSEDGFRIPAYHWQAERVPGRLPAALIHVPGGPGLQGVPVWEPYIPFLTSRGIDVIYMNYRGQTGYGASYENIPSGVPERAQELLVVRRHIIEELGIREDRVILYGHSYGSPIVMYAAAQEKLSSPLLFVSATPMGNLQGAPLLFAPEIQTGNAQVEPYDRCVVAFHGGSDIIVSPSTARASILGIFGRRALREPCGHFDVIANEGHVFEAAESHAKVFTAAARMVESSP